MSNPSSAERHYRVILVLACLVVGLGMRALHLRADPPPDLSPSGGYFADEGFWSHNARNKVLFGQWETNEWNDMWTAAPNHWIQYLTFSLVGVGLRQARLAPVVLSVPLILLTYHACRRHLTSWAWVVGAALAGTDFLLVTFNRLALLETPTLVFLVGAAVLVATKHRGGRGSPFAAGCLLILALATKRTAAVAGPGLLAALALGENRGRRVLWFILGCVAASLAWLLYAHGHLSDVMAYHRYYASQQVVEGSRLRHLMSQPLLSYFAPALPILALGLCGAIHVWRRLLPGRVGPSPLEAGCLVWLIGGVLYLGFLGYRPLRYYIPLLPPLLLLAASWLGALGDDPRGGSRPCLVRRFGWTWLGGAAVGLLVLGSLLGDSWPGWKRLGAGALAVGFAVAVGTELMEVLLSRCGRARRRALLGLALGVALLWNAAAYVRWASRPSYAVYDASLDIARLPAGSVLTGQWSLELTLESAHRAIPVWNGFVNDVEPFRRYGITHAAVWDRHLERFGVWFPDTFGNARVLRTYRIKNSAVYLLALDAHGSAGRLGAS
jgi:4-amino-4-deoxy-L-arabinose transferase-like glycosyltransferase